MSYNNYDSYDGMLLNTPKKKRTKLEDPDGMISYMDDVFASVEPIENRPNIYDQPGVEYDLLDDLKVKFGGKDKFQVAREKEAEMIRNYTIAEQELTKSVIPSSFISKEDIERMNLFNDNFFNTKLETPSLEESLKLPNINPYAGIHTDATYGSSDLNAYPKKDDEFYNLKQKMVEFLKSEEGESDKFNYPYVDNKGYITIGTGLNIHNYFNQQKWGIEDRDGLRDATQDEINQYFDILAKYGKKNYKASYYKDITPLRISKNILRENFQNHLDNDVQKLYEGINNFDKMPIELQMALTDIRYNTGSVTRSKWPNLRIALDKKDLPAIINNIGRAELPDRTEKIRDMLRNIDKLEY